MAMTLTDILIDGAPFAKVVTTERGEALMIESHVFEVSGPMVDGKSPAEALAVVLRRLSGMSSLTESPEQEDQNSAAFQRGVRAGSAIIQGYA
jgi:hypothetical protein